MFYERAEFVFSGQGVCLSKRVDCKRLDILLRILRLMDHVHFVLRINDESVSRM